MNIIEIKNLKKQYPKFLLDDVSFSLEKGYIMGFIGENGAGKTTTIKSMLNVTKRDAGSVSIFGKNVDEHEIEIKEEIGFMTGEVDFYPRRKLSDITNVYRRFYSKWDEAEYQRFLKAFHLDESKKISELSKGMKTKYTIALALSHNAKLLILDEPTSGLDPVARDELLELFQKVVEDGERSILFSTHITSDLEKCADFITYIHKGKIVASTSKDDLIETYYLISGSSDVLDKVKSDMISHKTNSFGFTGLIERSKLKVDSVKKAIPTLEDIMIYFAYKEEK